MPFPPQDQSSVEKTTSPHTPFHTHPHSSALTHPVLGCHSSPHPSLAIGLSQKLSLNCVTNSSRQKDLPGLHKEWKTEKDTEHVCHELPLPLVLDCKGPACQILVRVWKTRGADMPMAGCWVCVREAAGVGSVTKLVDGQ